MGMISIFMLNVLIRIKMTEKKSPKQELSIDEVLHSIEQRKKAFEKLAKSLTNFSENKNTSTKSKPTDDGNHTSKK